MNKNKITPNQIAVNFRLPYELHSEMSQILEKTEKSSAAFISNAVEYYIALVKEKTINNQDTLKIDRFAWGLCQE